MKEYKNYDYHVERIDCPSCGTSGYQKFTCVYKNQRDCEGMIVISGSEYCGHRKDECVGCKFRTKHAVK